MRTCIKCGTTKDLDEFSPNPKGRGGRSGRCKACAAFAARRNKRRRDQRAPEEVRCRHGDCPERGQLFPEGYGFRFCDRHAPAARQVLDHPVGRAFSDGDGNNKEWE